MKTTWFYPMVWLAFTMGFTCFEIICCDDFSAESSAFHWDKFVEWLFGHHGVRRSIGGSIPGTKLVGLPRLAVEITYTVILNKLPFMWISKSWVNISLPWDLQKKIRQSSKANVEHHGRTCARFLSLGKSLGWNLTSKKSCAVQGMVDSIKVSPYQL